MSSKPGSPNTLTMTTRVRTPNGLHGANNCGDNQSDLDSPGIQQPHQYRSWSETSFGRHYENSARKNHRFVITSYNILAQSLYERHPTLYLSHDEEYLQWPYRLNCIVQELIELRPSILTLQEVQDVHLGEIEAALAPLQYAKPLYKQRTAIELDDGCAIFYDPKKFHLLEHQYVEYYQPNAPQLDRTNVAIIAKFASTHLKDSEFIVATTHLLFNPRRDDVRIAQIQVLLAELDRLAVHSKTTQPLPIILTGDFNSEQLSPPYRLITEGCIDAYNLPIKMEIMDNCQHFNVATNQSRTKTKLHHSSDPEPGHSMDDTATTDSSPLTIDKVRQFGLDFSTGKLWHKYMFTPTIYSEWAASTFQERWLTVDYIFYTKFQCRGQVLEPPKYSQLQLLANYRLPSAKQCTRMGPIPNEFFGSDHYLLAAEFVLLK